MSRGFSAALSSFVILSLFAIAIEASDNSTVNFGANSNITAFTTCKKVTNNSATGLSVYVPTQSSAEWSSFYTNPPAGVAAGTCGCALPWGGTLTEGASVTAYLAASSGACTSQVRTCTNGTLSGTYQYQSCTDTCAGQYYGGYCYYYGGASQSCTTACSSRGGCVSAGITYANTSSRCTAILVGFGVGSGTAANSGISVSQNGCYVSTHNNLRWYNTGSTPSCSYTSSSIQRRACSCAR